MRTQCKPRATGVGRRAILLVPALVLCELAPPLHARDTTVAEDRIAGTWVASERALEIEVYRAGTPPAWQGKIVASPRPGEVGQWLLRDARYDAVAGVFRGTLVAPEAGAASVELSLVAPDRLSVVARRFLFSKTFVWNRRP